MATASTTIKEKLLAKLQAISKLQEVHDEPSLDFDGYPAAIILPGEVQSTFNDSNDHERTYIFDVGVYYPIDSVGVSAAVDAIYDVVDDVMDSFDQDATLTGISLPAGYSITYVNPVVTGWGELPDKKLVQVLIKLNVRVLVALT